MAEISGYTILLTLAEVRAIHKALGRMCGKDYDGETQAEAGSAVYRELTHLVDDDDE